MYNSRECFADVKTRNICKTHVLIPPNELTLYEYQYVLVESFVFLCFRFLSSTYCSSSRVVLFEALYFMLSSSSLPSSLPLLRLGCCAHPFNFRERAARPRPHRIERRGRSTAQHSPASTLLYSTALLTDYSIQSLVSSRLVSSRLKCSALLYCCTRVEKRV